MADFDSSLPVRTQNPGDVISKIADATTPSQQLTVNVDGSINITDNSGSLTVDAVNLDIRDLAFATDKVDVSGSSVTVTATNLDVRDLVFTTDKVDVSGSSVTATVSATNLDIRDLTHVSDSIKIGDGTDFLAINTDGSINVIPQEDSGTEVVNYDTQVALAAGATDNHDLVFASASKLYQVIGAASGKLKITIQIETGSVTGVFNTIGVGFNSTATPNINFGLAKYANIPAGAIVRVIRQNTDNQSQDVYSTIVGILG